MALFDSGARFDAGLRYDEASPGPVLPLVPRSKRMNQFKLELKKKTVEEKLAMGVTHITAMTGNANYPAATRVPTDAQVQTAQDELAAAKAAADLAENSWKSAIAARDDKEEKWDRVITARANNCEAVTPNDSVALPTTGFPMRSTPSPIGNLPAPGNLRATMGDQEGQIDLIWDAVKGASSYIVECKDHNAPEPWQQAKLLNQSRLTLTGLTQGKTYAFRVRALGSSGEGPWSDEAVKMAP
jgi:hypothetical protein